MRLFLKIATASALIFLGTMISSFTLDAIRPAEPTEPVGAIQAVGGIPYYLYGSGVSASETSITLTSFKQPVSSYLLYMADFGTIGYLTLEPGNVSRQEFVSFTGVTQNADGTATLTGVTRGLAPVSPYTASTTIQKAHSGGTVAVISNPPQLYETLLSKNNNGTSTAVHTWASTSPPRYDLPPGNHSNGSAVSTTSEFASLAYVNAIAVAGASNASETVKGLVELATALEAGSTTPLGSTGAALVLRSSNATDTPQSGCAVGYTGTAGAGCVIVAQLTGKLKQTWLNLSEAFTVAGAWVFNGAVQMANTVSIAASVAFPLILNGEAYTFPADCGTASSTAFTLNGTNAVTCNPVLTGSHVIVGAASTTSNTASTSITTVVLPGNTSGGNRMIRITAHWSLASGGTCFNQIDFGTGAATTSMYSLADALQTISTVMSTSSTGTMFATMSNFANGLAANATNQNAQTRMAAHDVTAVTYLNFISRAASGGLVCGLEGYTIEKLYQ